MIVCNLTSNSISCNVKVTWTVNQSIGTIKINDRLAFCTEKTVYCFSTAVCESCERCRPCASCSFLVSYAQAQPGQNFGRGKKNFGRDKTYPSENLTTFFWLSVVLSDTSLTLYSVNSCLLLLYCYFITVNLLDTIKNFFLKFRKEQMPQILFPLVAPLVVSTLLSDIKLIIITHSCLSLRLICYTDCIDWSSSLNHCTCRR